jgi:hypothetical protein
MYYNIGMLSGYIAGAIVFIFLITLAIISRKIQNNKK